MTTEHTGDSEQVNQASVHRQDAAPDDQAGPGSDHPLEEQGGPDSEQVDGEAEAKDAEEGGYGY